jgi:FAM91 N-terminus
MFTRLYASMASGACVPCASHMRTSLARQHRQSTAHTLHSRAADARAYAGDKEFRELTREEEALLRAADADPAGALISDWPANVVHGLYRRHLVYVDVPVTGSQRFSTSSLEGFVSNRDLVVGDSDPMEALLYEARTQSVLECMGPVTCAGKAVRPQGTACLLYSVCTRFLSTKCSCRQNTMSQMSL